MKIKKMWIFLWFPNFSIFPPLWPNFAILMAVIRIANVPNTRPSICMTLMESLSPFAETSCWPPMRQKPFSGNFCATVRYLQKVCNNRQHFANYRLYVAFVERKAKMLHVVNWVFCTWNALLFLLSDLLFRDHLQITNRWS